MDDIQRTDCNLPFIDLASDNASNRNHIASYIDLTGNHERSASQRLDIINLTDENNQHFTSNIPVIDLTTDDDQFLNPRIPVIDLTDDDDPFLNPRIPVIDLTDDDNQDITNQAERIDLKYNDASISNSTNRNFNLGGTDDKEINCSTKLIDLTHADIQDINPNKPVIDLTCDNDQFLNCDAQDIDMTDDDVRDIIQGLQNFDLTDGEKQNIDDCIPTNEFANHSYQSIGRIIPVPDLTNDKDCENLKVRNNDLIRNDYRIIRKPVDDVEMYDLSYNNSPNSFHKPEIESNLRIPATNLNCNRTESDSSNMNEMHIDTLSNIQKFHHRKEILENQPIENSFKDIKEKKLTNHSIRKNPEENHLILEKSKKISQNNTFDFMKPAHQPIPLRHSFGRSTVNTSQNVPIEGIEIPEGQTSTVSSIIHRKKSKSIAGVNKHNPTKSKNPSALDENAFSFETFKRFFPKFWIILILTFIGLYYWIL